MKDMFGYDIKEKPVKSETVKLYTSCRWKIEDDGCSLGVCGRYLKTDYEREHGLCERHQYCEDAQKAKRAFGKGRI